MICTRGCKSMLSILLHWNWSVFLQSCTFLMALLPNRWQEEICFILWYVCVMTLLPQYISLCYIQYVFHIPVKVDKMSYLALNCDLHYYFYEYFFIQGISIKSDTHLFILLCYIHNCTESLCSIYMISRISTCLNFQLMCRQSYFYKCVSIFMR